MSKSSYLEDAVLDAVLNNTSLAVTTPYISLHDDDPGETGANEVTGGSYARQSGSFGAAASGVCSSDANITFTGMPAGDVVAVGIWDASGAGNNLWNGWLGGNAPKLFNTLELVNGDITCENHGFAADDRVVFSAEDAGALPTGISAGTIYWVITAGLATDTFRVATTSEGSAIVPTADGSGKVTEVVVKTLNSGDTFQINSGDLDVYDF